MSEITRVNAGFFNSLVKDGTILKILKDYNDELHRKDITNLKDLIDNAMQEIEETVSKKGGYAYDDMTNPEIEQLEKFYGERINYWYNKKWKNELKVSKIIDRILKEAEIKENLDSEELEHIKSNIVPFLDGRIISAKGYKTKRDDLGFRKTVVEVIIEKQEKIEGETRSEIEEGFRTHRGPGQFYSKMTTMTQKDVGANKQKLTITIEEGYDI